MLLSVIFKEDWRCFKDGDSFKFRPGVNLLVGEQGCGKSSLIQALRAGGKGKPGKIDGTNKELAAKVVVICDEVMTSCSLDFEHENPRTMSYFGDDIMFQVNAMRSSHGQANLAIIRSAARMKRDLCILDEPDMALSIRSCRKLVTALKELADGGSQVVAAVHNMAVIQAFKEVYSLEHGRWMDSAEFIASHLECDHCGCVPCGCGG